MAKTKLAALAEARKRRLERLREKRRDIYKKEAKLLKRKKIERKKYKCQKKLTRPLVGQEALWEFSSGLLKPRGASWGLVEAS